MATKNMGVMGSTVDTMRKLFDVKRRDPLFGEDCVVLLRKKSGYRQNLQNGTYDTYRPSRTGWMSFLDAVEDDDVLAIYLDSSTDIRRCEIWVLYEAYVDTHPELCDGDAISGKVLIGSAEDVSILAHDISVVHKLEGDTDG